MEKLIFVLLLVFVVPPAVCCMNTTDSSAPAAPSDLSGNWGIAFDKDAICFGTMFLNQLPDGLVGTFACGPIKGAVDGYVDHGIAHLNLSAVYPDGRQAQMPVVGGIDPDGMAMHGSVNYPFQPGVPFAARRPFSF